MALILWKTLLSPHSIPILKKRKLAQRCLSHLPQVTQRIIGKARNQNSLKPDCASLLFVSPPSPSMWLGTEVVSARGCRTDDRLWRQLLNAICIARPSDQTQNLNILTTTAPTCVVTTAFSLLPPSDLDIGAIILFKLKPTQVTSDALARI